MSMRTSEKLSGLSSLSAPSAARMVSVRLIPGVTETAAMFDGMLWGVFPDVSFAASPLLAEDVLGCSPGPCASRVGARLGRAFNILCKCRVRMIVRSARRPSDRNKDREGGVAEVMVEMISVVNEGIAAA